MNYLVAGEHTHFSYNKEDQTAYCTHGGWGGHVEIREDGTCSVSGVQYSKYAFTNSRSFDEAVEEGLIVWGGEVSNV